jgi:hypothetical protein
MYLTVGQSDFESLAAAGVDSFATRVKVEGGDILGFRLTTAPVSCRRNGSTGDVAVASGPGQPDPPVGSPFAFGTVPGFLLNLAATVEPDSDSDDFGDETQDQCPTSASTQGPCPVAASGSTGQRAAALKRCKKKFPKVSKKRKRCIKKAKKLPV